MILNAHNIMRLGAAAAIAAAALGFGTAEARTRRAYRSTHRTTAVAARPTARPTRADSVARAMAAVMGPLIQKNLSSIEGLGLPVDRAAFSAALTRYMAGQDIGFSPAAGDAYIDSLAHALHPQPVDTVSVASQQAYMESMSREAGALSLPSGTIMIIRTEGEGPMPVAGQKVAVSYKGTLADGTVFDEAPASQPVTFDVTGVIPGFTDGLMHMRPGGTYTIVIPADKAYGAKGIPGVIPGNAALRFDLTLHSIQ